MTKRILFSVIFLSLSAILLQAQIDENDSLFIELKKQDSIFFERGFNQCDLEYLESKVSKELKFYHDLGGFQNREVFLERTKNNICSNPSQKPIRKVEPKSLTVYPLYDNGVLYGAIQSGIHHFFIREKGKEDTWSGTAKFTSVWVKENNNWKLNDVLSYDHHELRTEKQSVDKIEQLLKENNVPAMGLGIIENGKLKKVDVYGTLDKQNEAPYNTIFKVASLTKPIVAVTALKLIDKGLLELDEPLYKYWTDPDLKNDSRHKKLTPRIILSHQTGFPNWRYLNESNKLSFEFEPGTKYQYSGEGFEYLRKAIENKLGKSIEQLANEYLFNPAKMTDTRFWWDETMDEERFAQNFDINGNQLPTQKYYEANAAANLLTTIEDYGNFMTYVMSGAGLSDSLFQEMQTKQSTVKENEYFGLGWEILTGFDDGEYALFHTGKDAGVSTLSIIFPKSKKGYLIFLNGDNVPNIYEELLKELYLGNELWEKR